MAPAPPAAISLTNLRRVRSTFPLCFACGAPAFGIIVDFSLFTCLVTCLPTCRPTLAREWDRPHAIIADKARTGNGLFAAGSAGPILICAAGYPTLDCRPDGGAGNEAGLPIVSRRPDDQHPAIAECVAGQKFRFVDQLFVVRRHSAVKRGARRADPFAAFDHGEPAVLLEAVAEPLRRKDEDFAHQRRGPAGEAGAQRAVAKRRIPDLVLDVVEKMLGKFVILHAGQRMPQKVRTRQSSPMTSWIMAAAPITPLHSGMRSASVLPNNSRLAGQAQNLAPWPWASLIQS